MTIVSFPAHHGHPPRRQRTGVIAALDVGSGTIRCLIGERTAGDDRLRIIGHAEQAAGGISRGVIGDPQAAEAAIRLAVDAAEHMAGVSLREVMLNVSGGRPAAAALTARLDIGGGPVSVGHLRAARARALAGWNAPGREIVQVMDAHHALDGVVAAAPEGLHAQVLETTVHVVHVARGALRNLDMVARRALLEPAGRALAVEAAATAALEPDEQELGAIVIDLGAEVTSWGVWLHGRLHGAGAVAVAGRHISRDVAQAFSLPLAVAERLKVLHGSVLPGDELGMETLSAPLLGEGGQGEQQVPVAMLNAVIRPRAEEILELVRDGLQECPAAQAVRRVVLTGGGAQLVGLRELAERVLQRMARSGPPRQVHGLPCQLATPAYATACGLLFMAAAPEATSAPADPAADERASGGGYLSRMWRWLGEGF
ncbi:MAG TPA: cell division protein FtsA [Thermopetrobacter sp.]|nr:cell division protein FtsA [Thermopetrobacter sp.]